MRPDVRQRQHSQYGDGAHAAETRLAAERSADLVLVEQTHLLARLSQSSAENEKLQVALDLTNSHAGT